MTTTLVFGHKAPDTDSTGAPLIWAWYLSEMRGEPAEAVLLGAPSSEAAFVLGHWGVETPRVIDALAPGTPVAIVDTNNPAELPGTIGEADIRAIIDHHKLTGGLSTVAPIEVAIRPLACTVTVMHEAMGAEAAAKMPRALKGVMLSCILSDTLEFRSPTTTDTDRALAERLAGELNVEIPAYAAEMFRAKSDVSSFSDAELLRMDSKQHAVGGTTFRVSVIETTAPEVILARKDGLVAAMEGVATEDGVDLVLLFIVDILRGEATLLVPDDPTRTVAEKSFGTAVTGDTVVLPGVMSRKKQIIPNLTL